MRLSLCALLHNANDVYGPRIAAAPSSVKTTTRLPRREIWTWSSVGTEYSCPSEVRIKNGTNGTRSSRSRTSAIMRALYQKLPIPHHLLAVEPDVEIASHTVDMRFRNPIGAGVLGIRMTKREMNAGNL